MNLSIILRVIKQCFHQIPESDVRAKIGPMDLVAALVFGFFRDSGRRTLGSLRRSVTAYTGIRIDRSSFWLRMATNRLVGMLTVLTLELMRQLATRLSVGEHLLEMLNVKSIFILDSSSSTVPKRAENDFPAPRKNVVPAAIKWHCLFDLFGGCMKWFSMTPAKTHDRVEFPPWELLKDSLIIFDLGYWDYLLLATLDNIGAKFLSRIKSNAVIQVEKVVSGLPKKKFIGKCLFSKRLPKGKNKIIEVIGSFRHYNNVVLRARVIGFWNPADKCYHWYVTNLQVPAKIIYPLYRLRWQLELVFKAAKSSLAMADMPSANKNIIQSLVLISVVANLIAVSVGKQAVFTLTDEKQRAFSFQRAAMVLLHISQKFFEYLKSTSRNITHELMEQIKILTPELYDPNYKNRQTSLERVWKLSGISQF